MVLEGVIGCFVNIVRYVKCLYFLMMVSVYKCDYFFVFVRCWLNGIGVLGVLGEYWFS